MAKATRQRTKQHNSRLILKAIYEQHSLSRADLARETELTRPTVSSLVAELMTDQLVVETGLAQSTGGKPPMMLSVADDAYHLICLDLGNRMFRGAVVNLRGHFVAQVERPADGVQGEEALELIYQLVDQLTALTPHRLLGIGIGTPGLVEPAAGIVRQAVNLGWHDLPLRALLAERYDVPIYLANDSHAAALAEYMFGEPRDSEHLILLKMGQGIGAGIVLNGELFYGDGHSAGEIGHVVVSEENGRLLTLEDVASTRAILKSAEVISPQTEVNWEMLLSSDRYDVLVAGVGYKVGVTIAQLIGGFNVHHIVISGRVVQLGDRFLTAVQTTAARYALPRMAQETKIRFSSLGSDIVLLGCSALILKHELGVI